MIYFLNNYISFLRIFIKINNDKKEGRSNFGSGLLFYVRVCSAAHGSRCSMSKQNKNLGKDQITERYFTL